ncbi:hydantoinase/oxoprolinase family protein [Arthrobacter sp. MMS18-M83]|uniref:hydantoinase/oxoprolinase family protein n=1 Tax=Arthrobacter sp. MMS18-M83 TaxID=2996261 RepID=UPI00227ABD41|nr:hydantoinase/oxoprolinase family protein [Arthrobacter sp. MMS18-M83]WAH97485.1 hydantoinase/oxoprolinase family protein [Arthrobacter sp. MMS18-M83]
MERLINIDNGGTLTDICVWDGENFSFTKTLTTPFDLSQCLFDGIAKASKDIFGEEDLPGLLHSTRHIRYSTTQGTNALVERKGPRIGILTDSLALAEELRKGDAAAELFDDLVGTRIAVVNAEREMEELSQEIVKQVNRLTTDGAARLVIAMADREKERAVKGILLRKFPRHLLGSVPILFSWEFTPDAVQGRRVWSGIINSFLHPTMERFLYSAEHRLRDHKVKNPLLIYRNDGASSRVAKSVALKTYSSGPRGGLEGTKALSEAYGLAHVLMIDVGGTTTDVGSVKNSTISTDRRGSIQGIPVSFEMSNVHSSGVGGSSVIGLRDGVITVGPESVGAAPGPACFGFGGKQATITDVNLLLGVLDPDTYLDGGFILDAERSRAVITEVIADPLGITLNEALIRMEAAYFERMSQSFANDVEDADATTVAAFGGAGPMSACGSARIAGVRRVLVPEMAAVFSAFGIGFSDIAQTYEANVAGMDAEEFGASKAALLARATRDMFQEGHEIDECRLEWNVVLEDAEGQLISEFPYLDSDPQPGTREHNTLLTLTARYELPHASIRRAESIAKRPAVATSTRNVRSAVDQVDEVPVFELKRQTAGASAEGPAIVEGPYFTARVPHGWTFDVTVSGDLLLTDTIQK